MNTQDWRSIISGQNRTWPADLARLWLSFASIPYGIGVEARNAAYSCGVFPVRGVSVPVISIGNLTVGGTGKTPTVVWMVHQLQSLGTRPAILSRGYRALSDAENDEKKVLDSLCPGVPHHQEPDRLNGARQLLAKTDADVIVLDDGFQHRRLHRDLDIVLVDALDPWGPGWLLPRGTLRERRRQLSRADVILLTRCDLATGETSVRLTEQISKWTDAPILRTSFAPTGFVNALGETLPLSVLAEAPFLAFSGIGNPAGFRQMLSRFTQVRDDRIVEFPDHHHYTAIDRNQLAVRAAHAQAERFITTRKDLVKLPSADIRGIPLWALEINLVFQDSPEQLLQLLQPILTPRPLQSDAGASLREDVVRR